MKNIITAALWAGFLVQAGVQVLLWDRVKKLEQEQKEKPAEGSPATLETDAWEKLWAKGLEGIMSYGVADARGERRNGE